MTPSSTPAPPPLRLGQLGAASIAKNALIDASRSTGDSLVAVAARSPERGTAYALEHGFARSEDSYAALLASPDIEAVYIPLPNGLHGPWAERALLAGKHVLVEKPFASSAAEARRVLAVASRTGLVAAEAFHYALHPLLLRLRELLSAGAIGRVTGAEIICVIPAPPATDARWNTALAGGTIMDVGCYGLHAAAALGRYLGGPARVLSAVAEADPADPEMDRAMEITLGYPTGPAVRLRTAMNAREMEFSLRISGERGELFLPCFVLPHRDDRLILRTAAGESTEHLGTRSSYAYQLEAFAAAVRGVTPFPVTPGDTLEVMNLIDDAYRAAGMSPRPGSSL
ncbi:Gfo/Idh/MocA family protein [Mycetocola spongiae]|uniref:Gfo/Idh/MocA family protein n=1 Tax=Mycetocola spongiae TaxID=2859226 RepID=UPI001CF53C13|nr:Gfo/Idh/MocA family oxidoreductase [Mycetocola spongiae]UCR88134.1 Gfo/Idh/MocA family oxidoreductase [Mycetocola spongiae]